MKKFLLFLILLIFAASYFHPVFAQSDSAPSQKVDYELPYPGLLPDSPLYFLKVTRDRVIGFLITDPIKKANFDLLVADKRLNAAIYLFDKNQKKESLAETTISKGENYFEEALRKAREGKSQMLDAKDLARRLSLSSRKHLEIIKELKARSPANLNDNFGQLEKRVEKNIKEADLLMPK